MIHLRINKFNRCTLPMNRLTLYLPQPPASLYPTFLPFVDSERTTMLVIPGFAGKDTCDGVTRRDFMRVGGSAIMGFGVADLLAASARANQTGSSGGPGFGKAKSVIMIYLQGGPSHLDLWDPKPDAPAKNRSIFKPISTKINGLQFSELLPKLAQVDR